MKHTKISNIVITNKNKQEGFIKFQNRAWREIYNTDKAVFDNNDAHILGFLKNYAFSKKFDYNKIAVDICNKCYNEDPPIYKLKFSEFIITVLDNEKLQDLILDTKSFIVKNCDNDINDHIILDYGPCNNPLDLYILSDNIDITIVDTILSSLIDYNKIRQYQKICYNILVEQTETIVFEDYDTRECLGALLSHWLSNLIYTICPYGSLYNFDKATYKKTLKINNPRVVFITTKEDDTQQAIFKQLEIIKNLGIKNIVVKYKTPNIQYNYKKYIEYINTNKDKILSLSSLQDERYLNYTYIFSNNESLFNNFLKWCCTKK